MSCIRPESPRSRALQCSKAPDGQLGALEHSRCARLLSLTPIRSCLTQTAPFAGSSPGKFAGLSSRTRSRPADAAAAAVGLRVPGSRHAAARALMCRYPAAFLPSRCDRRLICWRHPGWSITGYSSGTTWQTWLPEAESSATRVTTRCSKLNEVAPARFWARFPSHWCHGIVRHLEGCVVSHRSTSIRE